MRIPGITYHQGRNSYSDRDGVHYGLAIHNTSNTASDESEASYADHRTDGTSSHFYCDRDSVTQSLDTNAKAGHAGSSNGNENAIAFEITGTNDKSRDWWLSNVAWSQLGYVIAYLIQHDPDFAGFQVRRASVAEMKSNPKVKAFYSHNDMRLAWGGTTHDDPGPNFPWDRLFSAVNEALGGTPPTAQGGDDDMAEKDVIDIVNLLTQGISTAGYANQDAEPLNDIAATLNLKVLKDQLDAVLAVVSKPAAQVTLSDAQFADLKATLAAAGDGLTGEEVEQAVARALAAAKLTTSFGPA